MNKDRPVMSATKLQPTKCTFQRCIDQAYVDSARLSSAQTMVQCVAKCVTISKTVGDTSMTNSAYVLSIDTKIDDLG